MSGDIVRLLLVVGVIAFLWGMVAALAIFTRWEDWHD